MKYYKAKQVIADGTTISFKGEKVIHYAKIDGVEYLGTEDDPVAEQSVEIAAQELTYAEIKPILDSCHLMKTINGMIENEIAEHYSIQQEIKMVKLPETDPARIAYQTYVDACKALFRPMKQQYGLIQ